MSSNIWLRSKGFVTSTVGKMFPELQSKRDDYGCVTITEKNFQSTVIGSQNNVLVVYYTSEVPIFTNAF